MSNISEPSPHLARKFFNCESRSFEWIDRDWVVVRFDKLGYSPNEYDELLFHPDGPRFLKLQSGDRTFDHEEVASPISTAEARAMVEEYCSNCDARVLAAIGLLPPRSPTHEPHGPSFSAASSSPKSGGSLFDEFDVTPRPKVFDAQTDSVAIFVREHWTLLGQVVFGEDRCPFEGYYLQEVARRLYEHREESGWIEVEVRVHVELEQAGAPTFRFLTKTEAELWLVTFDLPAPAHLSAAMESLILRPGMKLVPPRREPIDEARMMTLFGTSSVASDDSVDMTSLVERSTEANGAEPSVAKPKPVAVSPSGSVRLFGPLDPPVVLGRTKDLLGEAAYACVLALLQAQGNPLRSKQLDAKAKALRGGVSMCDARKHLLRLITTDPDWAQAIDRPGNSRRGGYVIR